MTNPHPEFYFIRHGETEWNAEQRLQGQREIPLNSKGQNQANKNGERLRTLINADAYQFISSPMDRTVETMHRVRHSMGLVKDNFATDARLKEVSFGDLEGFTLDELAEQRPEFAKARKADRWHFMPPNGESYDNASERVIEWVKTVDKPSVIVAHGGICRILRKYLLNLTPNEIEEYYVAQDRIFHWQFKDGKTHEEMH
jgi:probable phosphoglycerate mutase